MAELPATLRMFREAVANMHQVTKRLVDATEGIEQFTMLTSQMGDARRHLDEAASSLRSRLGGNERANERGDVIGAAMSDVSEAISAMADLNPFLRPQKPASKPAKRPRKAP